MVCLLTMLAVPGRAVNILYSDVPQDAWYMDGVEYVTKNGIMAGTGKGKFSPKEGMTRAMLVQVLYAAAGKPKAPDNPFVDVKKGSWYEESSAWAVENGIVSGYEGKKFGGSGQLGESGQYHQRRGREPVCSPLCGDTFPLCSNPEKLYADGTQVAGF